MMSTKGTFCPASSLCALIGFVGLIGSPLLAQDNTGAGGQADESRLADIDEVRYTLGTHSLDEGDCTAAARSFRLSAEQGHANSQYQLGALYAGGCGVPFDEAEAARWLRLAAEQGHASAQTALGGSHGLGRSVLKDQTQAVRWYRLAAEQGDPEAQFFLGFAYVTGAAVPQNYILAHMCLYIDGANGNDESRETRDSINYNLTREEIRLATELPRACMASDYRDCGP